MRRATPDDAHAIAPLILEAAPHLRLVLGDAHEAWHAAEACYRSDRTMFSHRFAMVAEADGRVEGVVVAFPGGLWGSLRLGTGVTLARAAGVRHAGDLVRRGRVLDRFHPAVPRETLYASALAVDPDRRRRGIGRALLQRLLEGAAGLGYSVALDLDLDNELARRLYASLGFQEGERRATSAAERELIDTPGFVRMVLSRPA